MEKCDCKERSLEKITETQVYVFKGRRGMLEEQTKFYECNCCSQIFKRDRWYFQGTGQCEIDSGYIPEVKLTKEEIIENAPKSHGIIWYQDKEKIIAARKNKKLKND